MGPRKTYSARTGTSRRPEQYIKHPDLRGWLPVMGVTLSEQKIDEILSEAERALAPFVAPGGEVVFHSPAHIVIGSKPN